MCEYHHVLWLLSSFPGKNRDYVIQLEGLSKVLLCSIRSLLLWSLAASLTAVFHVMSKHEQRGFSLSGRLCAAGWCKQYSVQHSESARDVNLW